MFYVQGKTKELGPYTEQRLQEMAEAGKLTTKHLIRSEEGHWRPFSDLEGVLQEQRDAEESQRLTDPPTPLIHPALDPVAPKHVIHPHADMISRISPVGFHRGLSFFLGFVAVVSAFVGICASFGYANSPDSEPAVVMYVIAALSWIAAVMTAIVAVFLSILVAQWDKMHDIEKLLAKLNEDKSPEAAEAGH